MARIITIIVFIARNKAVQRGTSCQGPPSFDIGSPSGQRWFGR